jgi:hypothetical protein
MIRTHTGPPPTLPSLTLPRARREVAPERQTGFCRGRLAALGGALALLLGLSGPFSADARDPMLPGAAVAAATDAAPASAEDPRQFVDFVVEDDANCQLRDGQHVSVRSTHPSRSIRVWLDRYYRNVGTGDRSHSDLKPAADPEALGCTRVMDGVQEWRVIRALFIN